MLFIFTTYINNINQKKSTQKGAFCVFAQLPNITGSVSISTHGGSTPSGALLSGTATNAMATHPSVQSNPLIGFNAHTSNAVYTDSGKVYPLSLALNFIIKA